MIYEIVNVRKDILNRKPNCFFALNAGGFLKLPKTFFQKISFDYLKKDSCNTNKIFFDFSENIIFFNY